MPTPGEQNLPTLLSTMEPTLDPKTYVFITTTQPLHTLPLSTLQPTLLAHEAEGITIVTTADLATSHGLEGVFPCKRISLTVHSSLEAVGLIAAITDRLKGQGISTNVVSGYYHDHVYVPVERAEDAMRVLGELIEEMRGEISCLVGALRDLGLKNDILLSNCCESDPIFHAIGSLDWAWNFQAHSEPGGAGLFLSNLVAVRKDSSSCLMTAVSFLKELIKNWPGSLHRKVNLRYSSPMIHIHRSSRKTSNTNNRRHDRHRETHPLTGPTTTGAEIRMILFYLPRPETPER